jgi:hypothetical protein
MPDVGTHNDAIHVSVGAEVEIFGQVCPKSHHEFDLLPDDLSFLWSLIGGGTPTLQAWAALLTRKGLA